MRYKHASASKGMSTRKRRMRKSTALLSLALVLLVAVGGTLAYLAVKTPSVVNNFEGASVSCEVTESFNGSTKTAVNVKNTGDISAYIRVKLVSYRVNDEGDRIGGLAEIADFDLGDGWVYYEGYYYYTKAVAAGAYPATNLADTIELVGSYDDADGGRQVIEVMAEAIQAEGTTTGGTAAVVAAWGVDPTTLGNN